ncbi:MULTISPECIES: amidohydrolase [Thermoanaerobacterium]|uniref:Amidohydrolase n=2 Tax=Thermoanaerobacterium TaxID=28895 RepID=W9E7N0_9THEO|nr:MULTISPECIES: amidohydrolase [Thermoanaerobacterium]AFK87623.1 amidohydrolase [Thermoanaerobacterium saccharolyticum JW/SL-YS485]ETO37558.1 amidohydrolase [Thermoanaerobacterium aotearoense SCUT27]
MYLLKGGKVLTMAGKNYEKADVLIGDGKILDVGEEIIAPLDAEIIDVSGLTVMPGMIDAHCHLGMWENAVGFEGADGNEETDPITPQLRAIDGINPMDKYFQEAYEAGVTTAVTGPGSANVIGGQFVAIKTYGRRIDDMIVKEPVAVKVAFGENPKSVYNEQHKMPMTRMGIAALLRQELIKAQEYMEDMEKDPSDDEKKPSRDLGLEVLVKVLKREIPLKAHAHRADDIFTALRIAKEFNVDITIDHCTEGHLIADYLVMENAKVIVGPSLSERSKVELANLTFKTPGILSKAGLDVAIMTDHPVIPLNYLPVCAGLAVREGMDEMEALRAITINPAKIVGIDDRVGSIEKGKDADIAVFDGNPIEIKTKTKFVFINGQLVFKR